MKDRRSFFLLCLVVLSVGGLVALLLALGVFRSPPPTEALRLRLNSSSKKGEPAGFVTHTFTLANRGRAPDSYELKADFPSGWKLVSELPSISLSPGEEETVFVTLGIPPGTPEGTYRLNLLISSRADPKITSEKAALIRVPEMARPAVRARTYREAGKPGEELTCSFLITNHGNTTGTFKITIDAPVGWAVKLPTEELKLAPGESERLPVHITISEDASPGLKEMILRAASGRSSDEAEVGIEVLPD